ncbi:MAG: hypothetical protein HOW73_26950 [Polyangiaceae bacterium]|nr:hypothetical protein [Polyangiaceae bacterium]
MGTDRYWLRGGARLFALGVLAGSWFACNATDDGEEDGGANVVDAQQDAETATGEMGVGVMRPIGLEIEGGEFEAEDFEVYIRSFDPEQCMLFDAPYADVLGTDEGFAWNIWLTLPNDGLAAGKMFDFANTAIECPDCILATVDSQHIWPEPLGAELSWGGGSSGDCNADYYEDEEPSHLEVLSLDDTGMTVQITNLCVLDWDEEDRPIVYSLDGSYRIQRCAQAASGSP